MRTPSLPVVRQGAMSLGLFITYNLDDYALNAQHPSPHHIQPIYLDQLLAWLSCTAPTLLDLGVKVSLLLETDLPGPKHDMPPFGGSCMHSISYHV